MEPIDSRPVEHIVHIAGINANVRIRTVDIIEIHDVDKDGVFVIRTKYRQFKIQNDDDIHKEVCEDWARYLQRCAVPL